MRAEGDHDDLSTTVFFCYNREQSNARCLLQPSDIKTLREAASLAPSGLIKSPKRMVRLVSDRTAMMSERNRTVITVAATTSQSACTQTDAARMVTSKLEQHRYEKRTLGPSVD